MRDNFNFNMLPIVQDNMNHIAGVRSLTNLSSNGYYGYQAPLLDTKHKQQEVAAPEVHVPPCFMEFESLPQSQNRKRSWEFNDFRDFKKRRQNESSPFVYQQSAPGANRDAKLRKPTHNIPDMPRCIMEKISVQSKKKAEEDIFEELLKETHGCTIYHWNSDGGI